MEFRLSSAKHIILISWDNEHKSVRAIIVSRNRLVWGLVSPFFVNPLFKKALVYGYSSNRTLTQ